MSPKSASKRKRSSLQWTEPMDQILIDALLHQVTKGNRANNQFTSIGFDEVVHEVCTKTQMNTIDKDKVKNRTKTLKRSFTEAYGVFKDLSGFGWNPITKLFEADNELWNDLVKQSDPGLIQWKTRPISQYDKLKEIWGKDSIDHSTTMSSYDSSQPQDQRGKTVAVQFSNACINQVGNSTKKRKTKETLAEVTNGLINVLERIVATLKNGNSILERSIRRVYSDGEVYAELERMEFNNAVIFDVYEFLTANQLLVRQMFGLPIHIRKDWLFRKLNGQVRLE